MNLFQNSQMGDLQEKEDESIHSDGSNDPKESFWLQIMTECQLMPSKKLPSSKAVVFFGDDYAQAAQLIGRCQGIGSKLRKGNGLDYHFLNVRDEYCESHTKLNLWVLDREDSYEKLLRFVINADTIADTTIVLIASMAKPWDIYYNIRKWVQVIEHHIKEMNIPSDLLEQQRIKVLQRFREYVEPTASIYGSLEGQNNSSEIVNNLGIEILIVITQTEHMITLQNEYGFIDEHFDFIQFALRKFCLSYGASLCYVSIKDDRNCDLFLKYILHKVYSFPFRIPAMFLDRDSIFVPSGWDSENKIQVLAETLVAYASPYEEVILKPARLCETKSYALEAEAQNDQLFLQAVQDSLSRLPDTPSDINKDSIGSTGPAQRNSRRVSRSPGVRSPQKKIEAKIASGEGDTVLQTFFKSLLNRRTSAPADRPVGLSGTRDYSTGDKMNDGESHKLSHDRAKRSHLQQSKSLKTPDDCHFRIIEGAASIEDEHQSIDALKTMLDNQLRDVYDVNSVDHLAEFLKKQKNELGDPPQDTNSSEPDISQLPEYFMSSQSSEFCAAQCCSLNSSSSANGNAWDESELELDRVKSVFNPPIKQLLESSDNTTNLSVSDKNGDDQLSSNRDITNSQSSSNDSTSHHVEEDCARFMSSPISAKPDVVVEALKKHVETDNLSEAT